MIISTQVMTVWVLTLFLAFLAGRGSGRREMESVFPLAKVQRAVYPRV